MGDILLENEKWERGMFIRKKDKDHYYYNMENGFLFNLMSLTVIDRSSLF
jgi:hypothetical protein